MSEAIETAPVTINQLPPGMTVTVKTERVNNVDETWHVATFGTPPRTISVVDLDMGAQFDLAEVTGGTDNLEYRNLAFVAASVREIDGRPTFTTGASMSKSTLRTTLRLLGRDGMKAATAVINGFADAAPTATEADYKAAVGN